MHRTCTLALLLFGWLVSALGSQTALTHQWTVDDVVARDQVAEWRLSPSGRRLAWTVACWDAKDGTRRHRLYWSDLGAGGAAVQLTAGEERIDSLRWLPGETGLSFQSSRSRGDVKEGNVWSLALAGGEAQAITRLDKGVTDHDWVDGDTLLYSAREGETLRELLDREGHDGAEAVEDESVQPMVRLFLLHRGEKRVERLAVGEKPVSAFLLSPDHHRLVVTLEMSPLYDQDQKTPPRHYLLDLATRQVQEILEPKVHRPTGTFVWETGSAGLYATVFRGSNPRYTWGAIRELVRVDAATGAVVPVPLGWDRGVGELAALPVGFCALLPAGVTSRPTLFRRPGKAWQGTLLSGTAVAGLEALQLGDDGRGGIVRVSTASQPPRFFRATLRGTRLERGAEVMVVETALTKRPFGRTEVVHWPGARGESIEGILYYPVGYEAGKKYPLILMIHGGPHAADEDSFADSWGYAAHLYCERGALVLKANYHGSAGYGLAFGESIAGHYYELEVPDLEAGIDRLVADGKADPERLGVVGWSNGAILGTALIVHSPRFKAASLGAGDVDWFSDYGLCAFGVSFDNFYFGGAPWEVPQEYLKRSPLFQLPQVTTPTLLFHGTADRQVPYGQSWEFYRALQQIGKAPVRFISFPDERHGLAKLATQRRKLQEEVSWFDRYLFTVPAVDRPGVRPGSPLEQLAKALAAARVDGLVGESRHGVLVPETVEYEGIFVGRFEVTRAQWAAFDPAARFQAGTGNLPVTGVTWARAREYVAWLSRTTGETYRLPSAVEAKVLYTTAGGNTLDVWAGYRPNYDDARHLLEFLRPLGGSAVLLKAVGSMPGTGDSPVFDLDGNAAEWTDGSGKTGLASGASVDRPAAEWTALPADPACTGLRAVRQRK